MAITSSMGTHKLYIRKGSRTDWVDYTGTLDSTVPTAQVVAGRVFTITAGKLVPGLQTAQPGLFALSGLDANNYPDVTRSRGMPRSGAVQFATVTPFAAIELVSTEFAETATYAVGAPLTASRTTAAHRGIICLHGTTSTSGAGVFNGTFTSAATDPIIGYVAPAGKYTDADGNQVLAFYPAYVIGSTAGATFA
jgi:hypothetical protein